MTDHWHVFLASKKGRITGYFNSGPSGRFESYEAAVKWATVQRPDKHRRKVFKCGGDEYCAGKEPRPDGRW